MGVGTVVVALSSVFSVTNCASEDSLPGTDFGSDADAGVSIGGDASIHLGSQGGASAAPTERLSALCGRGSCVPDDGAACDPGNSLGGYGGNLETGDDGPSERTCRVIHDCGSGSCMPLRTCGWSGSGERGDPCFDSADCSEGFACVGDALTGSCQPYCCRGTTASCGPEDFCGARPLAGGDGPLVPVCIPTEPCSLVDPFPCPPGRSCACTGNRACVVVRPNGQTACAVPGEGKEGDSCTGIEPGECAHGYVCSPASGCLKLCNPLGADGGCDEKASCQTPAGFPSDLGVCVLNATGAGVAK